MVRVRKVKRFFQKKLRQVIKPIVPKIVYYLMHIWLGTCRVTEHKGNVFGDVIASGRCGVGAFWHYSIVFMLYHARKYSVAVMVSASSDGDYLAGVAKELGFQPIRGSRHRRGLSAFKEMLTAVKNGSHAAIVADGSKGPVFKVQAGSVLIASKTGSPLIPLVWSGSKYVTVRSWDRTAFPLPFSRIDIFHGEPIDVPPDLTSEEIEKYRSLLEEKLNDLYREAWAVYGKEKH